MSNALDFLLALQAELGGAIPAERYFQEALYHPVFGYYSNTIRTVGRRGDFATSVTLGESLGRAIANWLASHKPDRGEWHVIEAGAGNGDLARTVLRRLGIWKRRGLTYHIVESSPVLAAEQRRAIPQFRAQWHDNMPDALRACGGRALIFSNELVDAFPFRVYESSDSRWLEVGVRIENGRVRECGIERPIPASSAFENPVVDGQRVELQPTAAEWFSSWSHFVESAHLLTIDYGDLFPEIYHRRPRGTARAYFHHQRFEGAEIYQRFGKQDITCDVNFTDLQRWTEHCGWHTDRYETQSEFLARFGAVRPGGVHDAQLADHSGAGGAFKVLHQSKGLPPAAGRTLSAKASLDN